MAPPKSDNSELAHKDILRNYLPLFKVMKGLSKKQQQEVIPYLNSFSKEALCAVLSSCVRSTHLSKKRKLALRKKLVRHKNDLRKLSRSNSDLKDDEKEKLLVQIGGFPFSSLLGLAIPLIGDLIGRAVSK